MPRFSPSAVASDEAPFIDPARNWPSMPIHHSRFGCRPRAASFIVFNRTSDFDRFPILAAEIGTCGGVRVYPVRAGAWIFLSLFLLDSLWRGHSGWQLRYIPLLFDNWRWMMTQHASNTFSAGTMGFDRRNAPSRIDFERVLRYSKCKSAIFRRIPEDLRNREIFSQSGSQSRLSPVIVSGEYRFHCRWYRWTI